MDCTKAKRQLSGLVDDVLTPSERASLLEHLDRCPSCQDDLESTRAVIRMVRSLPEVSPPADFRAQLFQRIQTASWSAPVPSRRAARSRWYQWSIAAAAVLMLVWSVRFASVKPPAQRPTDIPSGTVAANASPDSAQVGTTGDSHSVTEKDSSGKLADTFQQATEIAVTEPKAPETTARQATGMTFTISLMSSDDKATTSAEGTSLTTAQPPSALPEPSPTPAAPVQKELDAPVAEPETATVQTTPNPSFTTPRNQIPGDRHREEISVDLAGVKTGAEGGGNSALRLEECVTRLRISSPGPDELRQRLKILCNSEQLPVAELTSTSSAAQFSVRGTSEQIARLTRQIVGSVTVVTKEAMVVDLEPEWLALKDLIGQERLAIVRREALLRQAKSQAEIDQQEIELGKARTQLQSHEKALRALEARVGTAVLEIGY